MENFGMAFYQIIKWYVISLFDGASLQKNEKNNSILKLEDSICQYIV